MVSVKLQTITPVAIYFYEEGCNDTTTLKIINFQSVVM